MKFRLLFLFLIFFLFGKSQSDTILFNDFSLLAYDSLSGFQLESTNDINVELQGWKTRSDMRAISNKIIETFENDIWFDDQIWRNWHMHPYIQSIDTLIDASTVTYDTIIDFGLRSFSWFENPNRAATVLMTPPIKMYDNTGQLSWKSMPMQGPRHQDGYKVYILKGGFNNPENTPFQTLNYDFVMKELDVTNSSPLKTITSLVELDTEFGFVPDDGTDHIQYTLPDTNEVGKIDSTRQHPFMQEFSLDLAEHIGFFQVAFVHDSYDNNAIFLDDILITGNGIIGSKEIKPKDLKIFPNPSDKELFVEFKDEWINPVIQIFDINGRLVSQQVVTNMVSINISELEPGQYLIRLQADHNVYFESFTKLN